MTGRILASFGARSFAESEERDGRSVGIKISSVSRAERVQLESRSEGGGSRDEERGEEERERERGERKGDSRVEL